MARKRENTEVRQQQIIDAAGRLIFKHGSEHLTVKRIAAEVGIPEAAIYRHFTSKKSILSFLLIHIEEVLLRDISMECINAEPITLNIIEDVIGKHFSTIELRKGISFQVIAEIIRPKPSPINARITIYNGRRKRVASGFMLPVK